MKRHTILGCEKLNKALFTKDVVEENYFGLGNWPSDWDQADVRESDVTMCVDIATFRHLGFDTGHLDTPRHVVEGASIAVDYFYGDYLSRDENDAVLMRKSPDNERLRWLEVYRNGLLLALLSQQVDAERKLTEWIEPWLPYNETSYLLTPEDNDYHKLLAEVIRDGNIASQIYEKKIDAGRNKRPKLLLACLNTIRNRDEKALSSELKKFLDYYLKSEIGKSGIATYFSIEGSILWHVGQRVGITPTNLGEKQEALIMTRESLGLAA